MIARVPGRTRASAYSRLRLSRAHPSSSHDVCYSGSDQLELGGIPLPPRCSQGGMCQEPATNGRQARVGIVDPMVERQTVSQDLPSCSAGTSGNGTTCGFDGSSSDSAQSGMT